MLFPYIPFEFQFSRTEHIKCVFRAEKSAHSFFVVVALQYIIIMRPLESAKKLFWILMKLQMKTTSIKQNNSIKIANTSSEFCYSFFSLCPLSQKYTAACVLLRYAYFFSFRLRAEKKTFNRKKLTCSKEQGRINTIIRMIARSFSIFSRENIDEMQMLATNDGVWIFFSSEVTGTYTKRAIEFACSSAYYILFIFGKVHTKICEFLPRTMQIWFCFIR